jgi:hypothetical protein
MVEHERLTITRAAKKLHIKVPTAKVILSNYFKNGKIFNKKCQPRESNPSSSEITPPQANQDEQMAQGQPIYNMQILTYNFAYQTDFIIFPPFQFL